ncbi:MAG: preprotein translocase subunit YajC [candidate division Zixibacteria bacterium]|nr:preprotein translocase subunit YajC [candidate division Zixibacteria bacterium]
MTYNWPILMAGGQETGGGGAFTLVWFGLIFVLMYLLLIRPQRKKQKEHKKLLGELKKGDKVVTSSGMFGTIFALDDERNLVVLKINDATKLEFLKSSIAAKVDK